MLSRLPKGGEKLPSASLDALKGSNVLHTHAPALDEGRPQLLQGNRKLQDVVAHAGQEGAASRSARNSSRI